MSEETIKWTQERIEKAAGLLEAANVRICVSTTLLRHGSDKEFQQSLIELQQHAYDIQTFLGPYGNGPIDQEPVDRTEMPAVGQGG